MPSLAHTLPCLASTVPKPSPLSYIQYFIVLTDNPVLQPRGTSRRGNLSHVAGANEMLPYGVPFDSLSFLYLTPTHFFDLKFPIGNRPFFRPRFFILTDGWMDGWWMGDGRMDGQANSEKIMYFQHFSKTIRYYFLVVSLPLRRVFKTFSKKKKKIKKFRTTFFFSDFFHFFSKKVNFSKTIRYFFLVVSLPLRRVFKTFSEKNSKKIKEIKFFKKFRTIFFFQRFFHFFIKKSKFLKNY